MGRKNRKRSPKKPLLNPQWLPCKFCGEEVYVSGATTEVICSFCTFRLVEGVRKKEEEATKSPKKRR